MSIILCSCSSTSVQKNLKEKEDAVVIANDSLEYEITIVDVGFTRYLNSVAQPMGFYTQSYMERWNRIYVNTWNLRFNTPRKRSDIYMMRIDYDPKIDYGLEVNYKLYNYFLFAQQKYGIRLDGGSGRTIRIN